MNQASFSFDEFINPPTEEQNEELTSFEDVQESIDQNFDDTIDLNEVEQLDVQKAVVESLAADKAKLDSEINELKDLVSKKDTELLEIKSHLAKLSEELNSCKGQIKSLTSQVEQKEAEICKHLNQQLDQQSRNPNCLALLDRDIELPDRFPGETRDHLIEVIKEAYLQADKEGRIRRAQVLESVLITNEPNGSLSQMRADVEKLFTENGNIISGTVIEELQKMSISHKKGEDFLLPSEILLRYF